MAPGEENDNGEGESASETNDDDHQAEVEVDKLLAQPVPSADELLASHISYVLQARRMKRRYERHILHLLRHASDLNAVLSATPVDLLFGASV
jgi:hypothetical protein